MFERLPNKISAVPLVLAFLLTVLSGTSYSSLTAGASNAAIVPTIKLLLLDDEADPNLPVANAGADLQGLIGETIQLDGSGSADPNDLPIAFAWSLISQPAESVTTLDATDIVNPQFLIDEPGEYVVQLIVNNGTDDSLPDTVTVRNTNRAPDADAGENRIALFGLPVTLDGSGSSDIDTDPLTFSWIFAERPDGSTAVLDDASAETPSFTPDVAGNYALELTVNDGQTNSDPDRVEILVGAALTLEIEDTFFGLDRQSAGLARLNFPAPEQGITADFDVNEAIIGLSVSELQFDDGETEKTFVIDGLTVGQTDLSISAPDVVGDTVALEVSAALISVSDIEPLSPTASRSVAISLSDPAPPGGVTVDLEVVDEFIATVAPAQVMINEGEFTPASNPQITGGLLGTTQLRATAAGFAPDERDITVALAANFDPENLDVPETLSREIILQLDAPAPTGGVEFTLSTSGAGSITVQNSVTINEGQLQSLPIELTGASEGPVSLTASAPDFIDATADITVVDAPDVFLTRTASNSHFVEAVVGLELQVVARILLEIPPVSAVDVRVSVPEDSGVLLSADVNAMGTSSIVLEDVLGAQAGFVTIQGTELGDNVPLSIEVFDANTTDLAGYEPRLSTVDIDPSGVFVSSSDYTTTTFSNSRNISVDTGLLFDNETPDRTGELAALQPTRGGTTLDVAMQTGVAGIASLADGATSTLTVPTNRSRGSTAVTPQSVGTTRVSISSQPLGFSAPIGRANSVDVTVVAPEAFLAATGSNSHRSEAVIGLGLQDAYRVVFEARPPAAVDVRVTVPPSSGVLLSVVATDAGTNQILFQDVTATQTPFFRIQGTELGDDVPITIEVFDADTTTAAGYTILASTVDVDPSGVFVNTSDYTTTTFSNNRTIQVATALLHDEENPSRLNEVRQTQAVRGGPNLTVPMQVDLVNVASLPAGASDTLTIAANASVGNLSVEPLAAGQATISISSPPANFVIPANRDNNVVATVTAPNAFLRSLGSASHQAEAVVGIDLQSTHRIRLATTPPAAVDVRVRVPDASGVLLSNDPLIEGGIELLFENLIGSETPDFHIQGTAIGDDVQITVEVFDADTTDPAGYNELVSTVDVDPSGVYIATADYETTTFSNNTAVNVRSAVLFDSESSSDGRRRTDQAVRGGVNLNVPMTISDGTVAVLPSGVNDVLSISSGSLSGSIDVDPLTAGVTNLSITSQPNANFTLPSDRNGDIDITVSAPEIRFNDLQVDVGDELQTPVNITLETAPPNPVDVTVEITSSAVALVSTDGTSTGSASVTFSNVVSTNVGTVFVQGLTQDTATQMRGSAAGYSDETVDVIVGDSGFRLTGITSNINAGSSRNFTISGGLLNANGTFRSSQAVRGGASFDVNISSSDDTVGTVTTPVTIANGASNNTTNFSALNAGTTTISIDQPVNFSPPVGATELEITVNQTP